MLKEIGRFGVDSGQVMIGDPCYLHHFNSHTEVTTKVLDKFVEDKDLKTKLDLELRKAYAEADQPNLTRTYLHTKKGTLKVWPNDFFNYEEYKEDGESMNDLIHKGVYKHIPNELDTTYSYSGACSVALDSKDHAGMLDDGMAVVASTGHGDGTYPVEADIRKGVIHSITITFIKER